MKLPFHILIILLIIALISFIAALKIGSFEISFIEIWTAFSSEADSMQRSIIMELRLPRASTAFIAGALLGVAGVLMQVLLRNPLADPYILGISGGAAVLALICILMGLEQFWISSGAFLGALLSMLLVFTLAHGSGGWSSVRLLLTGVVVASGWGAIISFLLSTSSDNKIYAMLFWLMGDLTNATMPTWSILVLLAGLLLSLLLARSLNVMARGDLQASALGVNVPPLRWLLYFTASLLTASAVTLAGSLGFVGLVAPHLLRLLGASDHRILIPGAALFGGCLLLLSDTLARTIIAPQQLPVGVITAFIGVPIFLFILNRGNKSV